MRRQWVEPDIRDAVIDYIYYWRERAAVPADRLVTWIGITHSKYHEWRRRYGRVNEHNASVPRDHWLEAAEKDAIIKYAQAHPLDGYRRLSFMMLDEMIVAVSPTSVYRVLQSAGLIGHKPVKPSLKGSGFVQPVRPHEHWHIDVSYINICGTFYYLCAVLDGCSRFIVHWDLREQMREPDIEIILQRARELFPAARPRVISDKWPRNTRRR